MKTEKWLKRLFVGAASRSRRTAHQRHSAPAEILEQRTLLDASPIATELLLNSQTARVQRADAKVNQYVAGLPDGGFVAVWQSQRQDGSGWGIFGQRFDAVGVKVGSEFQVNQTTRFHQRSASVAVADDGRFVVAWQSIRQDGSSIDVIARMFSANGTAAGNEFLVNQTTRGRQENADVAFLNDGNVAFTWNGRAQGDRHGVIARIFDTNGHAVTNEFLVSQFARGPQNDPAIAADASGGFWITWSGRGTGDRRGIFARRFDADGVPLAGQFLVNSVIGRTQDQPAIAASDDGRIVISWQSQRQDGSGQGVFARLYDQDGTAQGTPFQVNQTSRRHQFRPTVDFTADGGFAFVWTGLGPGDRSGIFLREYNRNATPESAERLVNRTTRGLQYQPGLSRTSDGFVVTWSGHGTGDRRGVFASLFRETVAARASLSVTTQGKEAGPANIVYTVTLSQPNNTGAAITFDLDDLGTGSALSGSDYTAIAGAAKISVAAGASTGTLTVLVTDDALLEATETVIAQISNSSNAAVTIGTSSATANITDNETATASLSVTTPGNEAGPANIVYTVTLSQTNNTGAAITFDLDDLGTGTALSGSDYTAIAGAAKISVAAGASTGTLTVLVTDDALLETTETVIAQISNSNFAAVTIGTPSVTANITDNDMATANLSVTTQGNEAGPANIVYTVTLSKTNNTGSAITFDLDDLGTGTALSGSDYTAIAANAQISVAAGASTGTLAVLVTDDALLEATETVIAHISNSSNATVMIGTSSATANITDNDTATASLSVTTQGNEAGPANIVYTVTLSKPNDTGSAITFDLDDLGTGTALSGSDYTAIAANAQISVAAGASTGTLTVLVSDDALLEATETLIAQISNSSFAAVTIGTSSATANITDNDTATASLSVTTPGNEAGPANIVYTVTLSKPNNTGSAITFDLDDLGTGTATSGSDYTAIAANAQISVAAGASTGTLTVLVTDDALLEATETVIAQISISSNAAVTIGTSSATANITDNDTRMLSVSDVSVTEGITTEVPVEFQTSSLAVGTGPESLASAALNTDGFRDIVVANRDAGTVSVLLSNGDKTFQAATIVVVGTQPVSVIAIDLNGDGLDEVITADSGDSSLSLLLNASGTLTRSSVALSGMPLSIVAGDFIGSPSADIAVAVQGQNGQPGTILILPGVGDGTFGAGVTIQGGIDPFLLLSGNLDKSGKTELVSVNNAGGATVLSNNDSDVFTVLQQLSVNGTPVTAVLGDVDRDTDLDLVLVTSATSAIHTFLNDGSGSFGTPVVSALTVGVVPDGRSVITADFNNDLLADVAIVDAQQDLVLVLEGNGNGGFSQIASFDVGAAPFGLMADDLNNDGGRDLFTANFIGNSVTALFTSRQQTIAEFVITLNAASQQTVTVQYATAAFTASDASPDNDYTPVSGTLTFLPGETSKSVFSPIRDDLLPELLEQFFLELSNPLNALILDGSGIGTITDND